MTTRYSRRICASRLAAAAAGLPDEYRVAFGALYVYSPKGPDEVSEQSRLLCNRVKQGSAKWLKHYAARVHEQARHERSFCGFFDPGAVLIPIPKGGTSMRTSDWVARELALAIKSTGLAGSVWTGLHRVTPVARSSAAWMWERPTVIQHYESFDVMRAVTPPTEVVLIDDVVTKGRTLVAAAMRLHEVFPQAQIRAFALVRTMGLILDVQRLIDPCQGEIRWDGEEAHREP
jgi:hypothetical protein